MHYLEKFPDKIRPALEAIAIQANLDHRLTGYANRIAAQDAALCYFKDLFCRLAAELCQAVERGDFPYLKLTPALESLPRSLAIVASDRAECHLYTFERLARQALAEWPAWRVVQVKRKELAKLATNQATPQAGKEGLSQAAVVARSERRKAVIDPLLQKKSWNVPQWAKRAGVSTWAAREYLKGKSEPHATTADALATALDLAHLPE
jgi:hypothetical protein